MRKILLFILIVSALIIVSCEKETEVLPPEYEYLLGEWEMDSCIIIYRQNEIFEQRDTLSASELGYNMRFLFNETGFAQFLENTIVKDIKIIESIEINSSSDNPNILGYFIHYRVPVSFSIYDLSLGYNCVTENLKYSVVSISENTSNDTTYVYVFKKK